ncbi:MAG TPA: diacylglycerol kinase family protein [Candidatus Saccharimonadales bacterium]|nr:diacylglycerol kinase family protein [Candidatus Saccharimonadales bacterium]
MRAVVVIGTRAGRFGGAGRLGACGAAARVRRLLDGLRCEVLADPAPAALAAACRAAGAGAVLVAVGGDGTVNRLLGVASALRVPLAVVPAGTANDLAAGLGIPARWEEAAAAVRGARTRRMDLLCVNGVRFATCGGLGVAADAALRVQRWRASGGPAARLCRALGPAAYPLAAAREFAGAPRGHRLTVGTGEVAWRARVMCLLVGNQPRLGASFEVFPGARNDDGLLDACLMAAPGGRARRFWILARTLRGEADRLPEVSRLRCARLVVETEAPARFFGDGELLCEGRRFEVEVLPGALEVVVPAELPLRSGAAEPEGAARAEAAAAGARGGAG